MLPGRRVTSEDEQVAGPKLPPPLLTIPVPEVEGTPGPERDRDDGRAPHPPPVSMPPDGAAPSG